MRTMPDDHGSHAQLEDPFRAGARTPMRMTTTPMTIMATTAR